MATATASFAPTINDFVAELNTVPVPRSHNTTAVSNLFSIAACVTTFSASPQTLAFSYVVGGAAPAPQTISTGSLSPASGVSFTGSTGAGCGWLMLLPTSGTTPAKLTASVNPTGLAPNSYSCAITVTAPTASNSTQVVHARLAVTQAATLSVSPPLLSFAYRVGSNTTVPQFFSVASANPSGGVNFTSTPGAGCDWTALNATTGTAPMMIAEQCRRLTFVVPRSILMMWFAKSSTNQFLLSVAIFAVPAHLSILSAGPQLSIPHVPITFEPLPQRGCYLARMGQRRVVVRSPGSVWLFDSLEMGLAGAASTASFEPEERLPGTTSYFLGLPSRWRSGIPQFGRLLARNVYPGVDMVLHGEHGHLEYDFVVSPLGNPLHIRIAFPGVCRLDTSPDGGLSVTAASAAMHHRPPEVYQLDRGHRRPIVGRYRVTSPGVVGFDIAHYDQTRDLIIDPVIDFSTLLGGSSVDRATGIALDAAGNVYVAGTTESADFPSTATLPNAPALQKPDVFVTKLDPTGKTILYSVFIGGHDVDTPAGIAVDSKGNAYVAGQTQSQDFPTTKGAYHTQPMNGRESFALKLNATGTSLIYSTYLGSQGGASANALAIDSSGNAYVAGSSGVPFGVTPGSVQTILPTSAVTPSPGFLAKLNATGSAFVYATYLTGSEGATVTAVKIDASGDAYLTGQTESTDFPVTPGAPFSNNLASGAQGSTIAFVAKVNPAGSAFVYSTYLGSTSNSFGAAITTDSTGSAYIAGYTGGAFPTTPGAAYSGNDPSSGLYGFAAKLNPVGTALQYSTTLPAALSFGAAIAVNPDGDAYVLLNEVEALPFTGTQFSLTAGAQGSGIWKLNPSGTSVLDSFFLPMANGSALALGANNVAFLTGVSSLPDFPSTPGSRQETVNGYNDAFLTRVDFSPTQVPRLVVNATNLVFLSAGSNVRPQSFPLSVTSTGAPLPFRISNVPAYNSANGPVYPLKIAPIEGVTPAQITVSPNPSVLLGYPAYFAITAPGAENGEQVIPVLMEGIAAPVAASVQSLNFSFSDNNQAAASQSFTVDALGTVSRYRPAVSVPTHFQITTYSPLPDWLKINPTQGTTPSTITVTANPKGLANDLYVLPLVSLPMTVFMTVGPNLLTSALSPFSLPSTGGTASQTLQVTSNAAPISFAVAPPTASWLSVSPSSGTTPATLTVTVNGKGLQSGVHASTLTLHRSDGSDAVISVILRVGALPPSSVPNINLVQSAAYTDRGISPGALISIYGQNFATAAAQAFTNPLPITLGGVSVSINGIAAPLLYVDPVQINAQLPFEIKPGPATVTVTAPSGASSFFSVTVVPAAPSFFVKYGEGYVQPYVFNFADSFINGPEHPVKPGGYLVAYLTGQGLVNSPVNTGAAAPLTPLSLPVLPVTASIGGLDARVSWAGLAPSYVGLFQVNIQVPEIIPGDSGLIITVGGAASSPIPVAVAKD